MNGRNFPSAAFLLELELQAKIAIYAFEVIEKRIVGWRDGASRCDIENRISPLEAITYCTALVSSVAMIGKTLHPPDKCSKTAKRRGEALSGLVGTSGFSHIFDKNARNSNEHLDERLDDFLQGFESGSFHYAIKIGNSSDKPNTFLPRHLDPDSLKLTIVSDTLDLGSCHRELLKLCELINKAFDQLEVEDHDLYAT